MGCKLYNMAHLKRSVWNNKKYSRWLVPAVILVDGLKHLSETVPELGSYGSPSKGHRWTPGSPPMHKWHSRQFFCNGPSDFFSDSKNCPCVDQGWPYMEADGISVRTVMLQKKLCPPKKRFFVSLILWVFWDLHVVLLLLSLRYGADLCRSRLVHHSNNSNRRHVTTRTTCHLLSYAVVPEILKKYPEVMEWSLKKLHRYFRVKLFFPIWLEKILRKVKLHTKIIDL